MVASNRRIRRNKMAARTNSASASLLTEANMLRCMGTKATKAIVPKAMKGLPGKIARPIKKARLNTPAPRRRENRRRVRREPPVSQKSGAARR